jgi:translation initiation factor 5B
MLHGYSSVQMVLCGLQGPIVTTVRSLLTPHPLKELRVKNTYIHHKEIKAAQGIKIAAQGLEHAVAGTQLYVVQPEDSEEELKDLVMSDMSDIFDRKEPEGVCVQASTLGSLEALLTFLASEAVRCPCISAFSGFDDTGNDKQRSGAHAAVLSAARR